MKHLYQRLGHIVYWSIWPGSWIYLRRSERTRILLLYKDELLVVNNWLGAGKWKLPGGGLRRGEHPEVGMLRELQEETGIVLRHADIRHLAAETFSLHGFRYKSHYFTGRVDKKPKAKQPGFEIVAIAWVKRSTVSSKDFGPDVLRALELLDTAKAL